MFGFDLILSHIFSCRFTLIELPYITQPWVLEFSRFIYLNMLLFCNIKNNDCNYMYLQPVLLLSCKRFFNNDCDFFKCQHLRTLVCNLLLYTLSYKGSPLGQIGYIGINTLDTAVHKNTKVKVIAPRSKDKGPKSHAHAPLSFMGSRQAQVGHVGNLASIPWVKQRTQESLCKSHLTKVKGHWTKIPYLCTLTSCW